MVKLFVGLSILMTVGWILAVCWQRMGCRSEGNGSAIPFFVPTRQESQRFDQLLPLVANITHSAVDLEPFEGLARFTL